MIEFAWPWAFVLLPLPLLVWWLTPPYREQQESVQVPFFRRLADATGQTPQPGAVVLRRRVVQMVTAILAWLLTVTALARPQWVGDPVTHEVSARDLILAVDISGSMDQNDFRTPDGKTIARLDGVKRVIGDFVARRHGDRVALILFGTKPMCRCRSHRTSPRRNSSSSRRRSEWPDNRPPSATPSGLRSKPSKPARRGNGS